MGACVQVYEHTWMWRPQVDVWWVPSTAPPFSEARPLAKPDLTASLPKGLCLRLPGGGSIGGSISTWLLCGFWGSGRRFTHFQSKCCTGTLSAEPLPYRPQAMCAPDLSALTYLRSPRHRVPIHPRCIPKSSTRLHISFQMCPCFPLFKTAKTSKTLPLILQSSDVSTKPQPHLLLTTLRMRQQPSAVSEKRLHNVFSKNIFIFPRNILNISKFK